MLVAFLEAETVPRYNICRQIIINVWRNYRKGVKLHTHCATVASVFICGAEPSVLYQAEGKR